MYQLLRLERSGRVRFFLAALVVFSWAAGCAGAQESINNASIGGRVTDPSGSAAPGARVSARNTETNVTTSMLTDGAGRFRFPYLKVGPYELRVHKDGFADRVQTLSLTIGSAFDLPVSLALASAQTAVRVTGDMEVLEAARSEIAGTVTQTELGDLPLNGRNFLDAALLVPGVSPTNTAA
ncbi:MAG TPA: carboxypeptidase-like regulatory domain-containing protein, partial [Bryobacteraceae bacterium]|nr:carboxypeptidase-like regulatory domain-containing protein [Bryobacteraceae bacterium]